MNRFVFLFAIILFSCLGNKSNSTNVTASNAQTNDELIKQVIIHYQNENSTDSTTKDVSDTEIVLSFYAKDTVTHYYFKGKEVESLSFEGSSGNSKKFDSTSIDVTDRNDGTIYLRKEQKEFLRGDIDADGIDEIVYSVSVEGVGGGNSYWNDIFVFRSVDSKYKISTVTFSSKLTGDGTENYGGGLFYPTKIEKGLLIGEAICWEDDDAHCCPSLKYSVTVKSVKNQLVFNTRKLISREKQK